MVETVIVTGCAGFVGSNLTKRLLDAGIKVNGVDNFSYGELRNIESFKNHPNFNFFEGNLTEFDVLDKLEGEVLVHWYTRDKPKVSRSTTRLLDGHVGVVFYPSSTTRLVSQVVCGFNKGLVVDNLGCTSVHNLVKTST